MPSTKHTSGKPSPADARQLDDRSSPSPTVDVLRSDGRSAGVSARADEEARSGAVKECVETADSGMAGVVIVPSLSMSMSEGTDAEINVAVEAALVVVEDEVVDARICEVCTEDGATEGPVDGEDTSIQGSSICGDEVDAVVGAVAEPEDEVEGASGTDDDIGPLEGPAEGKRASIQGSSTSV